MWFKAGDSNGLPKLGKNYSYIIIAWPLLYGCRDVPIDERVIMTTVSFFFLLLSSFEFFTIIVTALCIKIECFFLCINIGLWFCGKSCGFSSQRINSNCITRTRFNLRCFLSLAVNPGMCQIKYRLPASWLHLFIILPLLTTNQYQQLKEPGWMVKVSMLYFIYL